MKIKSMTFLSGVLFGGGFFLISQTPVFAGGGEDTSKSSDGYTNFSKSPSTPVISPGKKESFLSEIKNQIETNRIKPEKKTMTNNLKHEKTSVNGTSTRVVFGRASDIEKKEIVQLGSFRKNNQSQQAEVDALIGVVEGNQSQMFLSQAESLMEGKTGGTAAPKGVSPSSPSVNPSKSPNGNGTGTANAAPIHSMGSSSFGKSTTVLSGGNSSGANVASSGGSHSQSGKSTSAPSGGNSSGANVASSGGSHSQSGKSTSAPSGGNSSGANVASSGGSHSQSGGSSTPAPSGGNSSGTNVASSGSSGGTGGSGSTGTKGSSGSSGGTGSSGSSGTNVASSGSSGGTGSSGSTGTTVASSGSSGGTGSSGSTGTTGSSGSSGGTGGGTHPPHTSSCGFLCISLTSPNGKTLTAGLTNEGGITAKTTPSPKGEIGVTSATSGPLGSVATASTTNLITGKSNLSVATSGPMGTYSSSSSYGGYAQSNSGAFGSSSSASGSVTPSNSANKGNVHTTSFPSAKSVLASFAKFLSPKPVVLPKKVR